MEISRLFSSGTPDLHLANFLHMITTMAESGSTEEQTEFFILNSQKMPKLPAGESLWSLANVPLPTDSETDLIDSSRIVDEINPVKPKKRPGITSSWPPTDWKTAPGFHPSRASVQQTGAASASVPRTGAATASVRKKGAANASVAKTGAASESVPKRRAASESVPKKRAASGIQSKEEGTEEVIATETCELAPTEMACIEKVVNDPASAAVVLGPQDTDRVCNELVPGTMKVAFDSLQGMTAPQDLHYSSSDVTERDQLYVGPNEPGTADPQWLALTGKLGEFFAFKYFAEKLGEPFVKWVNETNETGLPYDLVVGEDEYIEVKATRSRIKDWFHISSREWQFAVEKGESFSVAHVLLNPNNTAVVTVYKNPVRLCQLGKLQLALTISKS